MVWHLEVLAASSWTCTYILAQEILEQLPLPGLFFVAIVEKPILVLSSLHPSNKISPACTTCFLNRFNTLPITNDTHQKLETKHKDICIHYYSVGINYSSKIKWLFFLKKKDLNNSKVITTVKWTRGRDYRNSQDTCDLPPMSTSLQMSFNL